MKFQTLKDWRNAPREPVRRLHGGAPPRRLQGARRHRRGHRGECREAQRVHGLEGEHDLRIDREILWFVNDVVKR